MVWLMFCETVTDCHFTVTHITMSCGHSHMGKVLWFQEEQRGHFWPSAWQGTHLAVPNPRCRMLKKNTFQLLVKFAMDSNMFSGNTFNNLTPAALTLSDKRICRKNTNLRAYKYIATNSLWGALKMNSTQIQVCVCKHVILKLLQQSICTLCCVYVGMLSVDKSGHPCCTTDKSRSNTCPPPSHYRNTSTWEDTSQQVCSVNTEQAHFFWLDESTAFISHCRIEMCQPLEILL